MFPNNEAGDGPENPGHTRGAGSNLSGGSVPVSAGIVLA